MSKIDLKYCTLAIKDGSTHSVELKIGEGTLTWTEKKNMEYSLDRGNLDTVREGDQVPMEVKFDILWEFLRSDTAASDGATTPVDALTKSGAAAAWVSSSADACEPYAVDIEITYDPPCGGSQLEKYVLADFRHEQMDFDLTAGSIACSGKCNVTRATLTRLAQTTGTGSAD